MGIDALADELGPHGIRVNVVAPGIMRTLMNVEDDPVIGTEAGEGYLPMIPLRRWGEPEEVAKACLYLASDLASYVTGSTHVVDASNTSGATDRQRSTFAQNHSEL